MLTNVQPINGINFISSIIELNSADAIKDLCFQLKQSPNTAIALGTVMNDKAQLFIALSDDLVNDKKMSAAAIVKEISKEINGGGGGSAAFATAGGTNVSGLEVALAGAKNKVQ